MRNRIKEIRKGAKETQLAFAQRLNVSKSTIEAIEYGRREPTERIISDILRVYHINEEWLRYGTGSMYNELARKGEISKYFGSLFKGDESDAFLLDLIEKLAKLPVEDWEIIANLCVKLSEANNINNKNEDK